MAKNIDLKVTFKKGQIIAYRKPQSFLSELNTLLKRYDTNILRSANSTHDLVISMDNDYGSVFEIVFEEEIGTSDIDYERYTFSKIFKENYGKE